MQFHIEILPQNLLKELHLGLLVAGQSVSTIWCCHGLIQTIHGYCYMSFEFNVSHVALHTDIRSNWYLHIFLFIQDEESS